MKFVYKLLAPRNMLVGRARFFLLLIIATILVVSYFKFYIKAPISHTKTVFETLALILIFFAGIFITLNFTPIISLKITTSWFDQKNELIRIKTEIQNVSKMIAMVGEKGILLQVLQQKTVKEFGEYMNEWVAFSKAWEKEMKPLPLNPNYDIKKLRINQSTTHLHPGEVVATERVYKFHFEKDEVLHLALQFNLAAGPLTFFKEERWTTTCFFNPHEENVTRSPILNDNTNLKSPCFY